MICLLVGAGLPAIFRARKNPSASIWRAVKKEPGRPNFQSRTSGQVFATGSASRELKETWESSTAPTGRLPTDAAKGGAAMGPKLELSARSRLVTGGRASPWPRTGTNAAGSKLVCVLVEAPLMVRSSASDVGQSLSGD